VSKKSELEAKTRSGELSHRVVREGAPNLESVRRSVEGLRQLQQRIRKRTRGRSALSPAEVRAAIADGRK
jgi:hypothetical protein